MKRTPHLPALQRFKRFNDVLSRASQTCIAGNGRGSDRAGCAFGQSRCETRSGGLRFVAALGLVIAVVAVTFLPRNETLFGGMLVISPLTSLFKIICLALAFFTILLTQAEKAPRHPGEYLALVLLATVGLMLLVGSEELLMIFIGLELLGLSLYVLTAFDKTRHAFGRSRSEIFSVRQHVERVHTLRDQPDLRDVGCNRSRRDLN